MPKIVIHPVDLPGLGPMPPELYARIAKICRERPEILDQLLARLVQSEGRNQPRPELAAGCLLTP